MKTIMWSRKNNKALTLLACDGARRAVDVKTNKRKKRGGTRQMMCVITELAPQLCSSQELRASVLLLSTMLTTVVLRFSYLSIIQPTSGWGP